VGGDVLERLRDPGRVWVHLDVDVLDEDVFPATDYLMPGGLRWDELTDLLAPLLSSPALVGASVGCYNPEKDPDGSSGRALVEAFRSALGTASAI
jgi:arginase